MKSVSSHCVMQQNQCHETCDCVTLHMRSQNMLLSHRVTHHTHVTKHVIITPCACQLSVPIIVTGVTAEDRCRLCSNSVVAREREREREATRRRDIRKSSTLTGVSRLRQLMCSSVDSTHSTQKRCASEARLSCRWRG